MSGLLFIKPVFMERVWGGHALVEWYGAMVPPGVVGECWAISGLPGRSGQVLAGAPAGYTLERAWTEGLITGQARSDDFPLLCKLLDPRDWLSVQVHPDDEQARQLEGMPRGKAECWLVLSCEPGAKLILGHVARTADELRGSLADETLLDLLITHDVQPGSFFMVPPGCVHAVGPGALVYEVQQSSDITYRLYDFDRVGLDGEPRELHADKGFGVVVAPFDPAGSLTAEQPGELRRRLVDNEYFAVSVVEVDGAVTLTAGDYRLITVIEGSGSVACAGSPAVPIARAASFVVVRDAGPVDFSGRLRLVVTDPGPALAEPAG